MKYRDIFKAKQRQYEKINDLRSQSYYSGKDYGINEVIKKEKWKYKLYNTMLKGSKKDEKK